MGGGAEPPITFSKRVGALEGVSGKEGVTFFRGGCSFYVKNKLKSKIFNDKKSLLTKSFSLS